MLKRNIEWVAHSTSNYNHWCIDDVQHASKEIEALLEKNYKLEDDLTKVASGKSSLEDQRSKIISLETKTEKLKRKNEELVQELSKAGTGLDPSLAELQTSNWTLQERIQELEEAAGEVKEGNNLEEIDSKDLMDLRMQVKKLQRQLDSSAISVNSKQPIVDSEEISERISELEDLLEEEIRLKESFQAQYLVEMRERLARDEVLNRIRSGNSSLGDG